MKILLDCGHCLSGADTGAQGNGYKEQDCTREIGYKVKAKLEALGHSVMVVSCDSSSSVGESLAYRVNKANSNGGDLYISIHLNAGGGVGTEVYTYGAKHFTEADNVLKEICALGYQNRGIKDGSHLYVVRNTNMKAMLVECCFIDSSDMQKYNADNFANAIVKGITGQTINVSSPAAKSTGWVAKLQGSIGADVDNIPGPQTLGKCPLLKYGMNNQVVKLLQEKLGIAADGIFGNQTLIAVQQFQKAHGLQADGIVGQNTWRKLLSL